MKLPLRKSHNVWICSIPIGVILTIAGLATLAAPASAVVRPGSTMTYPDAVRDQSASVTYDAGWNLVGAPTGTVLGQAANPLYTFGASAAAYSPVTNTSSLQGGVGYWAFFASPATVVLAPSGTLPVTVSSPGRQFLMVGNPSATRVVSVCGADVSYTYSARQSSYRSTTQLNPGEGAWVYSSQATVLTLTEGSCPAAPAPPSRAPASPSPPSPPTNLQATVLSSSSIRLDWTRASANEDGFEIDSIDDAGSQVPVPGATTGPGETTFTLSNLQPNTVYCVVVVGFNSAGFSGPSNEVCPQTPPPR